MGLIKVIGLSFMVFTTVSALIFNGTDEGSCDDMQNVTLSSLDTNWFNSIKTWYLSAGSVQHLYNTALHFFDDDEAVLEEMPEYRFYYEACFSLQINGTQAILRGFDLGRQTLNNISMVENGAVDYIHLRQDGGVADISRTYVTLTDNQSFAFLSSCGLYANFKGWGVVSTTPVLSPDVVRRIEEHASAQGFDRKLFAFLRYDSCQPGVVLGNTGGSTGAGQDVKNSTPNTMWQRTSVPKGSGFYSSRGDGRMGNKWSAHRSFY
ncbi:unnamed protein product [Orchesella dallaii]|uniref:Uncharacterized protein n=1 Tax=Orchesella dallaii TaxID=48710 RepID=A0ABP1R279_9HEXA